MRRAWAGIGIRLCGNPRLAKLSRDVKRVANEQTSILDVLYLKDRVRRLMAGRGTRAHVLGDFMVSLKELYSSDAESL
jgi:hypothetical protein